MSRPLVLRDAPAIPGLIFRRVHNAGDYAGMAAVHAASSKWDQIDPQSAREGIPTAEDLASAFPQEEVNQRPDLLLAQIEGEIVGYNHVAWRWTEQTGTRVYLHLGYLKPQWRGKGIGSALLHWAQAQIRSLAVEERVTGPAMFATNVSSTQREADRLMRNEGYTSVRSMTDMALDDWSLAGNARFPDGVEKRVVGPEHFRAIYVAWKEALAGLFTTIPASEEDYEDFLEDEVRVSNFDPALVHIAWAGDDVAGLVLSHVRKGVGIVQQVGVRPAWQGRGIGRALMVDALTALRERRVPQVRLYTDAENGRGARSLYEGLGFHEVKQHFFYRKPLR